MRQEAALVPVAYRGFSVQSLLTVGANIECGTFCKDVIFLEFTPQKKKENNGMGYDKSNKISVLMNAIDLRSLSYACREIIKAPFNEKREKNIQYENITNSGVMKKITLGCTSAGEGKETYYINVRMGEKKIGVGFNKYDLLSFADSIVIIADDTERALYKVQRQMKRTNGKVSEQ